VGAIDIRKPKAGYRIGSHKPSFREGGIGPQNCWIEIPTTSQNPCSLEVLGSVRPVSSWDMADAEICKALATLSCVAPAHSRHARILAFASCITRSL
jgi:hypothetical protein